MDVETQHARLQMQLQHLKSEMTDLYEIQEHFEHTTGTIDVTDALTATTVTNRQLIAALIEHVAVLDDIVGELLVEHRRRLGNTAD